MEEGADAAILAELADNDLLGLRLAAQVMAHRAELERRGPVADYFGRLEYLIQAELASRMTGIRTSVGSGPVDLDEAAGADDRRIVGEYLGLLIGNEQLSPPLRTACRRLRSICCRPLGDA